MSHSAGCICVDCEDRARAANLWERLVAAWESGDGDDLPNGILDTIGALVDEWQAGGAARPIATTGPAVCWECIGEANDRDLLGPNEAHRNGYDREPCDRCGRPTTWRLVEVRCND